MVWYVSRETVKAALDIETTARRDAQVDRAIETASRSVESCLHRRFYPWTGTRYYDWPDFQGSRGWRLWLDGHEVVSVTQLVAGGQAIDTGDYFLEPVNDGPPYDSVEINLASAASFNQGSTHQRNIAITGVFYWPETTASAGQVAEALDDTETGVDVTDSGAIGVGDVILIGTERMIVTGKAMLDTGVNIDAADSLAANKADVSITMSTTTGAPAVGETILIGSERMLVIDVAGSVLTVKRGHDGSTLATHAANADIYAPRTLTVTRGALGTTAAAHGVSAAISRLLVPGPVQDLSLAYALNQVLQETAGYARVIGSGDNQRQFTGRGIADIEKQARRAYGRQMRIGAV